MSKAPPERRWNCKIVSNADSNRRHAVVSVRETGIYFLDGEQVQREFAFFNICGFNTDDGVEKGVFQFMFKPSPTHPGEEVTVYTPQCRDIQAFVNRQLQKIVKKETNMNSKEAARVIESAGLKEIKHGESYPETKGRLRSLSFKKPKRKNSKAPRPIVANIPQPDDSGLVDLD
eukprot:TRINITY_DN2218_c0_g1_i1.p1 TRINITY_DN2218_c0_g1~~TRINITY_DN2218_c0_g1_i1.p1  ORF type:complete len:174 (+),score=32.25 TRINITY_DN2218_c0_g1_i1:60-581(+)